MVTHTLIRVVISWASHLCFELVSPCIEYISINEMFYVSFGQIFFIFLNTMIQLYKYKSKAIMNA